MTTNPIKLIEAVKWTTHPPQPHQEKAWRYLEESTSWEVLSDFARMYRNPEKATHGFKYKSPITGKIVERIAALNLPIKKCRQKGYYNSYVVGIQGVNTGLKYIGNKLDLWNDVIGILSIDYEGNCQIRGLFVGTINPGRYYTNRVLNPLGAALVPLDTMIEGIWLVGKHRNQENCLIQIGNTIRLHRDSNKNGRIDSNEPLQPGSWSGINFHHANNSYSTNSIGRWSAGCAVIPDVHQHQRCMSKIRGSYQFKTGRSFDYIVLDGKNL